MKKLLIFLTTIGIFLLGCAQKNNPENPVIAKVNKTTITKKDFLEEISRVPEWARDGFEGEEGKKQFLEELIKRELIYQDAKKKRLHKDKEFLKKVEEFKKMTLISLILQKEIEEKTPPVTEAEMREFYNKNRDKFRKDTKIRASHILVNTKEEAKKILARIKKGESFSKLARSFSKDRNSAQKGGDLGFFGRGQMVPEFERVAFNLEVGEISDPVRTRFGYHIIKVTDKKEGTPVSFEEAKDMIRRQLLMGKRKRLFNSYIEQLEKHSKIIKHEEILSQIPLPWEQSEKKD